MVRFEVRLNEDGTTIIDRRGRGSVAEAETMEVWYVCNG